jgi:hypothetical protein
MVTVEGKRTTDEKRLLDMIDRLLAGTWDVDAFRNVFPDFYLQLSDNALSKEQFDFFGEIQEKAGWVSYREFPTDEDISDGVTTKRQFVEWLRDWRVGYSPTES